MVEVIKQYGQMIIAIAGTIGFLMIIGTLLFSNSGLLIAMIRTWLDVGF